MSTRYSKIEIELFADKLLNLHSPQDLRRAYLGFEWQDETMPDAWAKRVGLSSQLQGALKSRSHVEFEMVADEIHAWGFGGRPIKSALRSQPGFWDELLDTLLSFSAETKDQRQQRELCLAKMLNRKSLGIATLSKWVCFVDQTRFGIYDSRVSVALRQIESGGYRAFPIVPRRQTKTRPAFKADSQILNNPIRTARAYLDYLDLLSNVADKIEALNTAQIEMALFTLGNQSPGNGEPQLAPMLRSIWQ